MLRSEDRDTIVRICRRYGVTRAILFGSSARGDESARDIDLAVSGVPDERFYRFYGELIFDLSKPVDLVDLDEESRFTAVLRAEGVPIYG
jgi:predicted nucleotidyltransferase